ncbi:MAG: hypothetical protein E4H28_08105 [Gemmatimonadales bacterium]|nr:MAG: hypothetical protein E4H28_08105 [Gemmatimonadales bacterium]
MVGVDQLLQSTCAPVMGGTWLAKSPRLAAQTGEPYAGSYLPWLAMNQRGNTEWIVSGDTNHVNAGPHVLAGPPPYIPVFREGGGNWQFLKNLVEVPVPVG